MIPGKEEAMICGFMMPRLYAASQHHIQGKQAQ
jgi:hypothetical protein